VPWMRHAMHMPSSRHRIHLVVHRRPSSQMGWVDTAAIVTRMDDMKAIWDWPVVEDVAEAVGKRWAPVDFQFSSPSRGEPSSPVPATLSFLDFGPESSLRRSVGVRPCAENRAAACLLMGSNKFNTAVETNLGEDNHAGKFI
jgi:hypothetical protein